MLVRFVFLDGPLAGWAEATREVGREEALAYRKGVQVEFEDLGGKTFRIESRKKREGQIVLSLSSLGFQGRLAVVD